MKQIKEKYDAIAKEASDFKRFVVEKWSVAIALIVALSVKNLVNSLVDNILSPILAFLLRGKSIYEMSYKLADKAFIKYGKFFQEFASFIILMLIVFVASKILNKQIESEKTTNLNFKL